MGASSDRKSHCHSESENRGSLTSEVRHRFSPLVLTARLRTINSKPPHLAECCFIQPFAKDRDVYLSIRRQEGNWIAGWEEVARGLWPHPIGVRVT